MGGGAGGPPPPSRSALVRAIAEEIGASVDYARVADQRGGAVRGALIAEGCFLISAAAGGSWVGSIVRATHSAKKGSTIA